MELDPALYEKIKEHSDEGERLFYDGRFPEALECFRKLMVEYEEYGNPFTRLRYGECLYETGNEELAREHLLAAYAMEGKELFEECDKKYLSVISGLL